MQLIFMLVSDPSPDATTLVPGARHKRRGHLTYRQRRHPHPEQPPGEITALLWGV